MEQREIDFDMFPVYMGTIKKAMQKAMTEDIANYGLSSMHAMHLMMLYKNKEGVTLNEMSCGTEVDKANTTRVVNDLEEKGFVIRVAEKDRVRGYKVVLTEAGKKVAADFFEKGKQRKKILFSEFDDNDKEMLIKLMKKLLKGSDKMEGKNGRDI